MPSREEILRFDFRVKPEKRIRVIIDTDAACEADDQYAIVHALLTPKFDIRGIIAEQFGGQDRRETVQKSRDEIEKLLELMGIDDIPVASGAEYPLAGDDDISESEAADMIIREAFSADGKLYVLCQGAITNLAIALRKCPEIAEKIMRTLDVIYL